MGGCGRWVGGTFSVTLREDILSRVVPVLRAICQSTQVQNALHDLARDRIKIRFLNFLQKSRSQKSGFSCAIRVH